MNITEYYSEQDKNPPIFRGRATLQKGYTVVDATEPFYRYVGSNSPRPFPLLVHPDDAESVKDALERLDENAQRLIFRLLCDDGSYRYMYGVFEYNGREQDGFRYIDVNMLDIMRIHYRYDSDAVKLIKYRKYMSLAEEIYFEYVYATDEINVFEYINTRSVSRYRDTLSNLQESVNKSEKYTFKQKAEFESFYECLKNYAQTMELEIDGELFGLDCGYMHLNGGIIYVNNAKEMMVGTFKITGEIKKDDKYYMGPHAFDNATGVYNKRAIKEIAMELIAKSKDNKVLLSVMDIDDFKNINDTFGHVMGDEVIAKVAEIIKTTLGNRGYVGRFGGDEFMVVTDKVKDAEEFTKIFKTVRKNIVWSCGAMMPNTDVTLSLGLATYPDHATNYDDLFKVADKCLYIAKDKGKNRIISYKPHLHANFDMAAATAKKNMPMTFEQLCAAVTELMNSGEAVALEGFDKDLRSFLQCYNIDRAIIYGGEDYCCLRTIQNEEMPEDVPMAVPSMAFWEEPEASVLFDGNGVLVRNNIKPLKDTHPIVYEQLAAQGTDCFVAVKVQPVEGQKMLVFFDDVQKHHKWSNQEAGLLNIAACTIAQRYLQMMDK